jgi:hypothetical protein
MTMALEEMSVIIISGANKTCSTQKPLRPSQAAGAKMRFKITIVTSGQR